MKQATSSIILKQGLTQEYQNFLIFLLQILLFYVFANFMNTNKQKQTCAKRFVTKLRKKCARFETQVPGARCQVRGIRFLGPGVRFETQVPGSRCQVPGCQVSGLQFPGVQVPGSSIRKNKLWIDFYTCSCAFRAFLGISLPAKQVTLERL